MSKPTCPKCGEDEKIVRAGEHYGCQVCGEYFKANGEPYKK
ncbi:hypothetical protein [Thermoactinomyces mirandus]|nr:hypothetical protein [Thermoactinomyces mirandus]